MAWLKDIWNFDNKFRFRFEFEVDQKMLLLE